MWQRVRTTAPGYADTWARFGPIRDARDFATAEPQPLDGRRLDLGLRPPGVGSIHGQLTFDGEPVPSARVTIVDRDGSQWGGQIFTDSTGNYTFEDLWVGHYQLQFDTDAGTQYYHQKDSLSAADVVTVLDGPATIVDEQVYPPGFIDVTVTDGSTGRRVSEFCAFVLRGDGFVCTTTGTVRIRAYPITQTVFIHPSPAFFGTDVDGVVVRSGEVTTVAAQVDPAMALRTTVRDAATGDPVANTCLQPVKVNAPGLSTFDTDYRSWCSDASGLVTVGPFPVAAYRVLARPGDGVHGMQWVGRSGGTGVQERARRISPAPGRITTLPDIRLDPAGTISGTVRDEASGAPVSHVCVFPYATNWGFGDFCTNLQGQYQITGLGPYSWPLEFTDTSNAHGWRWSGGAEHRLDATLVRVRSGAATTADEVLAPSGQISGNVTIENAIVSVMAFNEVSGDWAGPSDFAFPDYTLGNLGTQRVKVQFTETRSGKVLWYLNAATAKGARPVQVRAGETTTGIDQAFG